MTIYAKLALATVFLISNTTYGTSNSVLQIAKDIAVEDKVDLAVEKLVTFFKTTLD